MGECVVTACVHEFCELVGSALHEKREFFRLCSSNAQTPLTPILKALARTVPPLPGQPSTLSNVSPAEVVALLKKREPNNQYPYRGRLKKLLTGVLGAQVAAQTIPGVRGGGVVPGAVTLLEL